MTTPVKWEATGRNYIQDAKDYTDSEVGKLGIEEINTSENLSIAIIDKDGRRTWLEANDEGKPTEYSIELILGDVSQEISQAIGIEQRVGNLSIAIIDKDGRRTWLEANDEGKPTEYAASLISQAIGDLSSQVPSSYKSKYEDTEFNITSGPNILCVGDSMTFGGGNGYPYPLKLKQMLSNLWINSSSI